MPFPKGRRPPAAGMGRKKGVPNKATGQLKEAILKALEIAGGERYLAEQALKNPGPFMMLLGRILPHQLTGPGDGPVQVQSVEERQKAAKAILDQAFGKEGVESP